MKNRATLLFLTLFTLLTCFVSIRADDKLTAEEIITKHLDSIGTKEKRETIKNQVVLGDAEFIAPKNGGSLSKGKIVIASELNKVLFGMSFTMPSYPFEKIGFDGDKLKIANVTQNTKSPLGTFVSSFGEIMTEGLLGGTSSNAWSLLKLDDRKAKFETGGTKKIDGKEAYVVRYFPKGGSDLNISLFFEKDTFRHLRTEYRRIVAASIGTSTGLGAAQSGSRIDNSAKQSETRYLLSEDFSDFKTVAGLTLPHSYKLYYSLDATRGSSEFEWKIIIAQYYFNQKLPATSFDIDAK